MRVPYAWLKEYVDIDMSPEELARVLTMQGVNVDAVERPAAFSGVVVGRVLEVAPHPNADRLRVCRVDVGEGNGSDGRYRTIVCGAPNVAAGQHVPVALPGAELPGGVRIGRTRLRGVDSEGMICSARELGLPDPSGGAGIMVLPELPVGEDLKAALGLEDAVLVLDLTPNYAAHCQSMIGVAREVAASRGAAVRRPAVRLAESARATASAARVRIEAPELCPRYAARVIRGVRVGPSPLWLQRRLEAAGMRPINNVVDVTNYVMLELGQPLHAFDYDRLAGSGPDVKEIIVRRAREGEKIVTLDGQERALLPDDLVIADARGAVAVAGVMGGESSEVTVETVNILLESACFDPLAVRRTARRLGIRSEAAARFEKGVDPEGCGFAADRAAGLIQGLAGGEVLRGLLDEHPRPLKRRRVTLRPERLNALLGTDLDASDIAAYLGRLGFDVQDAAGEALLVTVPTYRPDVASEADLAEEVARLHGYENIPTRLPRSPAVPSPLGRQRALAEAAREVCLAAGLTEVMTYSFMGTELLDRAGVPDDDWRRAAIPLANPLSADQAVMRTCLLPLLLEALAHNARHQQADAALFELGRVYLPSRLPLAELPEESLVLALAAAGRVEEPHWQGPPREADFYYLKGVVEAIGERLGLAGRLAFERAALPGFHPGRTARVLLCRPAGEPVEVGVVGEVHPDVAEAFDLPGRACAAELDFSALLAGADPVRTYQQLPRYPAVDRDLAFILRDDVPAARAEEVIRVAGGDMLEKVTLFDVYRGAGIPPGHRSLAYTLVYRAPDRTLTDAEVDAAHDRVRQRLGEELGARLRS